ncbi:DUF5994 family protein [Nocardioides mangrovicus]|uniref:DUF5994 family protein n=1 Tax=Nocardioides mangrovicus TaxID=2478913 RepID=UPI001E57F504|nr:DUF5994 family protein [Nocardioides mangrovicus]
MATTDSSSRRLALRAVRDRRLVDGAWWPSNRRLEEQLDQLFAVWPPERGRVSRVGYSPPDWEDRPRAVMAGGRRVKTGNFPRDDTHELTLVMSDGRRLRLLVIPPDTSPDHAQEQLTNLTAVAASG